MGKTTQKCNAGAVFELVIAFISVGLQGARKGLQHLCRAIPAAGGLIVKNNQTLYRIQLGPHVSSVAFTLDRWILHPDRRLINLKIVAILDHLAHQHTHGRCQQAGAFEPAING